MQETPLKGKSVWPGERSTYRSAVVGSPTNRPQVFNRDTEVFVRFKTGKRREEIYSFLEKIKFKTTKTNLVGIVQRPNGCVDITVDTKERACQLAQLIAQSTEVKECWPMCDEMATITLQHVPPRHNNDQIVANIERNGGKVYRTTLEYDSRGCATGRRFFQVKKESLRDIYVPDEIRIGNLTFPVHLKNRERYCTKCKKSGHDRAYCKAKAAQVESSRSEVDATAVEKEATNKQSKDKVCASVSEGDKSTPALSVSATESCNGSASTFVATDATLTSVTTIVENLINKGRSLAREKRKASTTLTPSPLQDQPQPKINILAKNSSQARPMLCGVCELMPQKGEKVFKCDCKNTFVKCNNCDSYARDTDFNPDHQCPWCTTVNIRCPKCLHTGVKDADHEYNCDCDPQIGNSSQKSNKS